MRVRDEVKCGERFRLRRGGQFGQLSVVDRGIVARGSCLPCRVSSLADSRCRRSGVLGSELPDVNFPTYYRGRLIVGSSSWALRW